MIADIIIGGKAERRDYSCVGVVDEPDVTHAVIIGRFPSACAHQQPACIAEPVHFNGFAAVVPLVELRRPALSVISAELFLAEPGYLPDIVFDLLPAAYLLCGSVKAAVVVRVGERPAALPLPNIALGVIASCMRTVAAEIISVHMLRIIFWYPVHAVAAVSIGSLHIPAEFVLAEASAVHVGDVLVVQTVDVSENVFPRVDADKLVVFIEPVIAERLDKPEIKCEIAVQAWKRLCAE